MNAFAQRFSVGSQAGPTIAIKDCIDVAGWPTRAGSAALADAPAAERDAAVVRSLLDAGWHIVGKTNMHELAYGMTGINRWSGTPCNPQDPALIPGGSSSGSAVAVGNGEVEAALGSDTGGSIRLPAACCGVIGLKPGFGRVDRRGAMPRDSSLDCIGPFARGMEVLNRVMEAIALNFDSRAAAQPLARARLGVVATGSDAAVEAAVAAALQASGWQLETRALPGLRSAFEAGLAVIDQETWNAFGHLAAGGRVGIDVARRLAAASAAREDARQAAECVRLAFIDQVDRALADVDALVLPTLPSLPPTLAEAEAGHAIIGLSALVRPFNLSGHPALSFPVPVPASHRGNGALKAGLQLVGRKGEDERLCALALHLERTLRRLHY
ncbi:amidase [Massilia niastensis]|uniref:amidase n=1 Tax=Massilia niastensis TaxID=544911 RepID=UPI0003714D40|nr:amidase [Massilia niastensis]